MTKPVILTAHAEMRARSRAMRQEWIEETARSPDWVEPEPSDPSVQRRFRAIGDFGGRILRVACAETHSTIRVISVMFDRNARQKP
jgi:hypothetical protein